MQEEKEEQIFGEVPDAGNFFKEDANDVIMREENGPKKKAHWSSKMDPKNFEWKLVEISLNIIKEMHKTYKFALIKLAAKLYVWKGCHL